MGVLKSELFTTGDGATLKKLEDCATGSPNEVISHFTRGHPNQTGEHIKKVQQALDNVRRTRPELGIPAFTINSFYDDKFATAVKVYKQKKDIRNFRNQIDDIIGIKTIRSLDSDNTNRPVVPPSPKPNKGGATPRPLPNCVPDEDCPAGMVFEIKALMGISGGEVVEVAKIFFAIRDTNNGLSAVYMFRGGGFGLGPSPVSITINGAPKLFQAKPVPVTRFGPGALMGGLTAPFPGTPVTAVNESILKLPQSPFLRIDTGPVSIPGISLHVGQFLNVTTCGGVPGASRRPLGLGDLPPL